MKEFLLQLSRLVLGILGIIILAVGFLGFIAWLSITILGYPENFGEVDGREYYLNDRSESCAFIFHKFHNLTASFGLGNPRLVYQDDKCCYYEESKWMNETETFEDYTLCENWDLIEEMSESVMLHNRE